MLPLNTNLRTISATDDLRLVPYHLELMAVTTGEEQAQIARRVLQDDPRNIEAYCVLSEQAATWAESVALLREAVRLGNRRYSAAAKRGKKIDWNGDREAASFIKSIVSYASLLSEAGYAKEAQIAARTALDLDHENTMARYVLRKTVSQLNDSHFFMTGERRGASSINGTPPPIDFDLGIAGNFR